MEQRSPQLISAQTSDASNAHRPADITNEARISMRNSMALSTLSSDYNESRNIYRQTQLYWKQATLPEGGLRTHESLVDSNDDS